MIDQFLLHRPALIAVLERAGLFGKYKFRLRPGRLGQPLLDRRADIFGQSGIVEDPDDEIGGHL
jgi:hypothetical protein